MNTMEKLKKITLKCDGDVCLKINNFNEFPAYYKSLENYLNNELSPAEIESYAEYPGGDVKYIKDIVSDEIKQKILETKTIVYIRFYQFPPHYGFNFYYHYDLDMLFDITLERIDILNNYG